MGPARYTRVTPGSGCGSPPGKRRDRRRRSPPSCSPPSASVCRAEGRGGAGPEPVPPGACAVPCAAGARREWRRRASWAAEGRR